MKGSVVLFQAFLVAGHFSRLQGRDNGATIDPWEDPEFEVYMVTDRYGFLQ